MILVFGSINIDLVARVASIPRPGETVLSPRYETLFGGKGANQAIAAARASLPRRVTIAACVGDDAFGRSARDNLDRNGVVADLVANSTEPTGCAFITVDEHGENAITVASGANATLTEASIRNFGIDASTVAVLQMEVPFPASLSVARQVRAVGGRVIWNFAPAPSKFSATDLSDLVNATDIFVVNEHEALAAAALLGRATDEFEEAGSLSVADRLHMRRDGRCTRSLCVSPQWSIARRSKRSRFSPSTRLERATPSSAFWPIASMRRLPSRQPLNEPAAVPRWPAWLMVLRRACRYGSNSELREPAR